MEDNKWDQLCPGDTLSRGNNAGDMCDDLTFVDLEGVLATSSTLGSKHSCEVIGDGNVQRWCERPERFLLNSLHPAADVGVATTMLQLAV